MTNRLPYGFIADRMQAGILNHLHRETYPNYAAACNIQEIWAETCERNMYRHRKTSIREICVPYSILIPYVQPSHRLNIFRQLAILLLTLAKALCVPPKDILDPFPR